jgi:hypothetical protein
MLITNRTSEYVKKLKYLEMIVKSQNLFHDESKDVLNLDNACYHSNQNRSFAHPLSKNTKN